jgi:hypothetical protein
MYQTRAQDVFKNLQAIQQFIPDDNKINSLIQQLQQTIQQGAQLFQRKASYNNKNTRLAIIGQFNAGQYGRDALIGAGTGAMVGAAAGGIGAVPGAILGAVGSGLGSGIQDIAYQFKNNYQKASWQAGEMRDKLHTMKQQLQPFSPQLANMLMKIAQDIKNEIEVRFEKKSGASFRNDYAKAAVLVKNANGAITYAIIVDSGFSVAELSEILLYVDAGAGPLRRADPPRYTILKGITDHLMDVLRRNGKTDNDIKMALIHFFLMWDYNFR